MFSEEISGFGPVQIDHIILDYNGTIAQDGNPIDGVQERIEALASFLQVHVLTADTHGSVESALKGWPCSIHVIGQGAERTAKLHYVEECVPERCAAIGNGMNDSGMLDAAGVGVAVFCPEGGAVPALRSADIICGDICSALDLFLCAGRLKATLRF
jgi:soluble P-type ATPase